MSIVEVVVAMTVFSVGILAAAKTMDAAFTTADRTSHRARALAVATKQLESLRAAPYESLVVQDPGDEAEVDSETVGGTTFGVERTITSAGAYKRVTVAVGWTDGAGSHEVSQTSFVYPSAAAAPTTTPTGSVLPVAPSITDLTKLQATGHGTMTWAPPANVTGQVVDHYVIQRALNSGFTGAVWTLTEREPPNSSSFDVSGLAAGTAYFFRIKAVYVDGDVSQWSPVQSVTTASTFGSTLCKVHRVSVAPSEVARVSPFPSPLTTAPTVTAETSGTCTGLYLHYDGPDGEPGMPVPLVGAGKVLSASIANDSSTQWQLGQYGVEVKSSGGTRQGTAAFVVCEAGGACG